MENEKISKIAEVMKKAEKLVVEEIEGKPEDQLVVAAGLMAVTRNLYVNVLGPEEAQKVFEVMLDSFILADEIYLEVGQQGKPTIH
jgi:hypothetical protein|tara:strand:- start:183 stop:440 length:258 start_codon:yes stop_codon:yes gene_type:complete